MAGVMLLYSVIVAMLLALVLSENFQLDTPCQLELVLNPNVRYALYIPLFACATFVICLFYGQIARVACSKSVHPAAHSTSDNQNPEVPGNQANASAHWKVTKALSIVIGVFVMTYFPYVLIYALFPDNLALISVLSTFWNINIFINPMIYGFKTPEFKRAFRSLFRLESRDGDVSTAMATVTRAESQAIGSSYTRGQAPSRNGNVDHASFGVS